MSGDKRQMIRNKKSKPFKDKKNQDITKTKMFSKFQNWTILEMS